MSSKYLKSPVAIAGGFSLVLAGILFFLCYQKINAVISWFVAVNLVTLIYYGYDKFAAKRSWGRIPELVLHGLAFVGGSPIAFVAQKLFRHKTIKTSFQIFYWSIVTVQIICLAIYFFKWAQG